jgi:peptidyl-prolyl isomerase E (cyclophilin E)
MSEFQSEKMIVYVGGLDDSVDTKILHSAFIPFGEIKSVEIPLDPTTGNIVLI